MRVVLSVILIINTPLTLTLSQREREPIEFVDCLE
jgi:hypothetical protein